MRKFIILLLFCIFCGLSFIAHEYHPYLSMNKRWVYNRCLLSQIYPEKKIEECVIGKSTMLNKEVYMVEVKRIEPHIEEVIDTIYLAEENRIVYQWMAPHFVPLMDFSVQSGDSIPYINYRTNEEEWKLIIDKVEDIYIRGTERKWIYLKTSLNCNWMEGIGCLDWIYYMIGFKSPMDYSRILVSCYEGDECIYSREDLYPESGIEEVVFSEDTDETIYDLMGQKVVSPLKGRIYIKNGKKYIQN